MTYALLAGAAALVLSVALGYPLVAFLRARNIGKSISADGPESHLSKAGTPTMGGILFVTVSAAVGLAAGVPKDRNVLLPVAVLLILGAIGWYDDLGTLVEREKREAHSRTGMILKLIAFAGVGGVSAWLLYDRMDAPRLLVPHAGAYDIGAIYVVVALAVFVATTAAVSVSDGLDMLLGGMKAVAFAAFGAIALIQDQVGVAVFSLGMTGALCGFLWFNAYPARLFMGDSGSLPLGGALAVVALMTGWWVLLPVIGAVFVFEGLSVVLQVGSFRLRGGKRIFRMAPVHHHFEQLPMHETRVTLRFVIATVLGALVGVALAAWK
ncbi:MAG: phospho-N-acetylmuramoyl-pentapeptide-transferase [Chloroflexi bacterium]|nr:phospho-N-acetylmuramoyl-pentapeptide-transferase [Chloroflexota bacterium]